MAATEVEIIEMWSQAESARQRLLEKRAALQLAIAELDKTHEERCAEILVRLRRLEALEKNQTGEQIMKFRNSPDFQVVLEKSWEVSTDSFKTARRIIESVKDVVDLMAEVNHHDKASLRAQVATLEQERDKREKKAYSLQLQLHEEMIKCRCLHSQVAKLEEEKLGKDLPFHKFI